MKKFLPLAATIAAVLALPLIAEEAGRALNEPALAPRKLGQPVKIFNGKDIEDWAGNTDYWTVQDGTITGKTTADKPVKHNTFLVWTGGTVDNFELTFQYRIVADNDKGFANSGVQYRSRVNQPGESGPIISGYQADFEAGQTYSGILYEERGRGILAKRGEKTVIKPNPADPNKAVVEVVGTVGVSAEIQAAIKPNEWNEYKIVAQGKHLQHFINGKQTIDVVDEHPKAAQEGVLALQLHAGQPMTVQFKDLVLVELK